jgi:hypothetical protein
MFQILSKDQYEQLSAAQKELYLANWAKEVAAFQAANPTGVKRIKMAISRINTIPNRTTGRLAVVTTGKGHPTTATTFTFAPGYLDILCDNVDLSIYDLKSLLSSSVGAIYLSMDIWPITPGDTYTTRDGVVGEYTIPHYRSGNESFELSPEVKEELHEITMEVIKEDRLAIAKERREARRQPVKAATVVVPPTVDTKVPDIFGADEHIEENIEVAPEEPAAEVDAVAALQQQLAALQNEKKGKK